MSLKFCLCFSILDYLKHLWYTKKQQGSRQYIKKTKLTLDCKTQIKEWGELEEGRKGNLDVI